LFMLRAIDPRPRACVALVCCIWMVRLAEGLQLLAATVRVMKSGITSSAWRAHTLALRERVTRASDRSSGFGLQRRC